MATQNFMQVLAEEPHEAGRAGGITMGLTGGTLCMAVSTFGFLMKANDANKRFHYVAAAVTGIATMAYLAMWCGAGVKEVEGRNIYWMRYVDWFFTTPFFLLDLALLAKADVWDTFFVMLMNAVCIACGAIGALGGDAATIPMFVLGMVTFVAFNFKLFGAMMTQAGKLGKEVQGKYGSVVTITMLTWCAYPIMYYLCEITGMLSESNEVMAYAVLDVFAKCCCGFMLISSDSVLAAVDAAAGNRAPLMG